MVTATERDIAMRSVLLASAPKDVADHLLDRSTTRDFGRGETIFLQGEPAHSVYIVLSGWAKLYRISPSGGEAVVGVFTKGRSFGEAVAFRNDVYPVAAEAVTDARLLQIRASAILDLMKKRPEVCISMLSATFVHLQSLITQIEQLKARTGAQRVAEFLLDLCTVEEGPCALVLPYEKALIAGRLGMKPESLSRAFIRLREEGVRISKNHAAIADVGRLRDYMEEDPAAAWSRSP